MKDLVSLILRHTTSSRAHLTPELVLRLITPSCPLWRAKEEELPFRDPFWAFYWPGGQATARYILDNETIVKNRRILDIGCGCGAGAIAAAKMNAKHVLANDIDKYATAATTINAELNQVSLNTSTSNFIGTACEGFDTVLVGDMFYDEEFGGALFDWLRTLKDEGKTTSKSNFIGTPCEGFDTVLVGDMFYDEEFGGALFDWLRTLRDAGKTVLVGDPGRHGLTAQRRQHLELLAKYDLPEESCIENHGFKETSLWKIN